jgi:hypothetical protein
MMVALLACLALGCKNSSEASTAPDPAALKAQKDLIAKRDALLAQREELQGKRDKLDVEIQKVAADGGDTKELAKSRAALDQQIEGSTREVIDTMSNKLDSVLASTSASTGDKAANLANREATTASREKDFAAREARIAAREKDMADREHALELRMKDTCVSAGPTIIQQVTAPPKDGTYGRKDVEAQIARAHAAMTKKGLVNGDLPGPAQTLESESTKAQSASEWSKAYGYATQLIAFVDAIKVDRPFVMAKYNRLNARVTSVKQDDATTAQLNEGMKDVLQKFGDGDFAGANRKLNALSVLVK